MRGLALVALLAAAACQRGGSEPAAAASADVALLVDGAPRAPIRIQRGATVVVAGNGHGDPAWVTARARGNDGRFVTAALARYPQGELRLIWRDKDDQHTLAFHAGASPDAAVLGEARGVTQIDVMTMKRLRAR